MNIKNIEMDDDDYSLHVKDECDVDCIYCLREQKELYKHTKGKIKPKQKPKNES